MTSGRQNKCVDSGRDVDSHINCANSKTVSGVALTSSEASEDEDLLRGKQSLYSDYVSIKEGSPKQERSRSLEKHKLSVVESAASLLNSVFAEISGNGKFFEYESLDHACPSVEVI